MGVCYIDKQVRDYFGGLRNLKMISIDNKILKHIQKMKAEQLNTLSRTDFTNFIQSENNVKYKIVIPFLHAFDHVDLDLEHAAQGSRIDINIGNKIIVETKALGQNINNHVQQLSDYVGRELPVLAILTNGRYFRIYSPHWRRGRTKFADKVLYEFETKDLDNIHLLERLEKILSLDNYKSELYLDYIEEREKEILQTEKEIEEIKEIKHVQILELQQEINELKEKMQEINDQIISKEQIVIDISANKIPEIYTKKTDIFFPVNILATIISNGEETSTNRTLTTTTDSVGDKFKIENHKKGVIGFGRILSNGNFLVLKGSIISKSTVTKFQTSAPSAYKKRQEYLNNETINVDFTFIKDVEFNSKSGAASLILGDSANGKKEWIKE